MLLNRWLQWIGENHSKQIDCFSVDYCFYFIFLFLNFLLKKNLDTEINFHKKNAKLYLLNKNLYLKLEEKINNFFLIFKVGSFFILPTIILMQTWFCKHFWTIFSKLLNQYIKDLLNIFFSQMLDEFI